MNFNNNPNPCLSCSIGIFDQITIGMDAMTKSALCKNFTCEHNKSVGSYPKRGLVSVNNPLGAVRPVGLDNVPGPIPIRVNPNPPGPTCGNQGNTFM